MPADPPGYRQVTIILNTPRAGRRYRQLLEVLRDAGVPNAAAFRSYAGLSDGTIELETVADVLVDLPDVILWVDLAERVDRVLPLVEPLVAPGILTVQDVAVPIYAPAAVADFPAALTVGAVMTRDVVSVTPQTPVRELVLDLLQRNFRAVPVIDGGRHVVGIVTSGDLVRRGGLPLRVGLLRSFVTAEIEQYLARMRTPHATVGEVMTPDVVTASPALSVRDAAELMRRRNLKRLPVLDDDGVLAGMLSRVDLLRTVAAVPAPQREVSVTPALHNGRAPIRTLMATEAPSVRSDAAMPEVLNAIMATPLNAAVVVDDARQVLGLITDDELIERLSPAARPGAFAALMHRLPFVHGSAEAEETRRHSTGATARDLARTDALVVRDDGAIRDVLAAMLGRHAKVVPVTNAAGELAGIVSRADLLRVLVDL